MVSVRALPSGIITRSTGVPQEHRCDTAGPPQCGPAAYGLFSCERATIKEGAHPAQCAETEVALPPSCSSPDCEPRPGERSEPVVDEATAASIARLVREWKGWWYEAEILSYLLVDGHQQLRDLPAMVGVDDGLTRVCMSRKVLMLEVPSRGPSVRDVKVRCFGTPSVRRWQALHRKLFTPATKAKRVGFRSYADRLRRDGQNWVQIAAAWSKQFGETLTPEAARTRYSRAKRQRDSARKPLGSKSTSRVAISLQKQKRRDPKATP